MSKIGSAVTTGVRKGDRVSGCVHGCRDDKTGSYAEYVVVNQGLVYNIPANTTFEQAASLPVALYTPLMSLYYILGLNKPDDGKQSSSENTTVLVWSGATSTGFFTIQLLKMSGYKVVTTASTSNHALLKSLGADAIFDYKDADVIEKVKKAVGGQGFKYACDTISGKESLAQVAEAMAPNGQIVVQLPAESPRSDVKIHMVNLYDANNEPYVMAGQKHPGSKEVHDFILDMMPRVTQWLADGKLQFQKITVRQGGLAGVQAGFEDMKANKVRAEKLVYKIADTP